MKRLAVVKVRGSIDVKGTIRDTFKMLNIIKVNNCTFIDNRLTYMGMLQKVKDYVTWGEVSAEDVEFILKHRGELEGGHRITDGYIKENTSFENIADFARDFAEFKAEISDIPGLKKVFRLHPPRKGHRGIKRSFKEGGSLGYRGNDIKKLLNKMR
ncbi:50S ribosomal protein L30P [archaeon]|nr:50S ribosomal protein L30P [archaeon]